MRITVSLFLFLFISISVFAQSGRFTFNKMKSAWADSVMQTMTLDEKIGQLLMVTTYPAQGESNETQIYAWIEKQHVGGVLFLRTTPTVLANCANNYQSKAKVPLFIALDAENGLSFRLDSVVGYPYNMALGAIQSDSLIYQMGREVGQQCRRLGVNLNFAPVVDVNSKPKNPVINYRSFGEDPQNVARKGWLLAKGIQDEKVIVSAKHFPGHGDTDFDSHLTLPAVKKNYNELQKVDFVPFKTCIDNGIIGVMSAHINMSDIDKSGRPATLSKRIMTDILKDSLGFGGLVFSDGMNMRGITQHFSEGVAAVEALKAGVDVIEFILNPETVIEAVKKAIRAGELDEKLIHEKCRRVLLSKQWAGIQKTKSVDLTNLGADLNDAHYRLTARKLYENCITVIQNTDSILPLQRLDTLKIASVAIGQAKETMMQKRLNDYQQVDEYFIDLNASEKEIDELVNRLGGYNLVIAGVYGTNLGASKKYGVVSAHTAAVTKLTNKNNTVLVFYSNPYALAEFEGLDKAKSILVTYGKNEWVEDYSAQLIFGAIDGEGKLPVTINDTYSAGDGFDVKKNGRLKYTIPEELGFNSELLKFKIDSLANNGVKLGIFPGCQVLVARKGSVIFHESYGYYTYDSLSRVTNDNLYDWASLTKITGTLPLLMKLVEDSVLNLDVPFSIYWPDFKNTDKENITLREILAHQAGFKPWIPFYVGTLKKNNEYRKRYLRTRPSSNFPYRVSTSVYINKKYRQHMFDEIRTRELSPKRKYSYSDLSFYLFPDMITNLTGVGYENYLQKNFIRPLGATTVQFNPYRFYSKNRFIPTERDDTFRKELLQGFVHDEGAAMLGGVSGNAGLFGTANDLAKIMQFYLNGGSYGDLQYLKPTTIKDFAKVQYPKNDNRRGLGFDKPYLENSKKKLENAYPSPLVSPQSFGHSGYTGTFAWADPKNQLLFIFMSNRVYPTRENTKISDLNFRPILQQVIYNCQGTFKPIVY